MRPLLQRLLGRKRSTRGTFLVLLSSIRKIREQLQNVTFAGDDSIVSPHFSQLVHPRECFLVYPEGMTDNAFVSEYVIKPLSREYLPPRLRGEELAAFLTEQVLPRERRGGTHSRF